MLIKRNVGDKPEICFVAHNEQDLKCNHTQPLWIYGAAAIHFGIVCGLCVCTRKLTITFQAIFLYINFPQINRLMVQNFGEQVQMFCPSDGSRVSKSHEID